MKTVSVAIILCLHIGVEPPGKNRPNPHAKLEVRTTIRFSFLLEIVVKWLQNLDLVVLRFLILLNANGLSPEDKKCQ